MVIIQRSGVAISSQTFFASASLDPVPTILIELQIFSKKKRTTKFLEIIVKSEVFFLPLFPSAIKPDKSIREEKKRREKKEKKVNGVIKTRQSQLWLIAKTC